MIGILIPEFPSQTHVFFWREIVALRRLGVGVRIISTRRPPDSACRHEFASAARDETHYVFPPRWRIALGVLLAHPLRSLRCLAYVLGLRQTPLRRRLRYVGLIACAADLYAFAKEQDIRHIHTHSCADGAHLAALCRILGGPPYSLMLHGDLPVYGTDHADKMRRAACVTCAGPHLVSQIVEQAGFPEDRVMPTWMGLDVERFEATGRRAYVAGALHLVTTARLDACKGHRYALAAVRSAVDRGADVRYTLIGEGGERPAIEAEIARLGLADRVTLLGTRGENEVLAVLREADAFVLPSVGLGEAAPVSLMEAMACGLPSICSVIGSTPAMLTDGVEGFLVAQTDVPGLGEAIWRLSGDAELRRRMGDAARRRAVAEFSVVETTTRLLDLIERTAGVALRPAVSSAAAAAPRSQPRPTPV